MADIPKKCKAAAEEGKKAVGDAAAAVKKWQGALDGFRKKKVTAKDRDKIIDQSHKAADDVLKAHQAWTKLTDDYIRAVQDVDARTHDLSAVVAEYDILIKRIVPGLKQALELEQAEMEKRLLELFSTF